LLFTFYQVHFYRCLNLRRQLQIKRINYLEADEITLVIRSAIRNIINRPTWKQEGQAATRGFRYGSNLCPKGGTANSSVISWVHYFRNEVVQSSKRVNEALSVLQILGSEPPTF
jgi:hypothetical protein